MSSRATRSITAEVFARGDNRTVRWPLRLVGSPVRNVVVEPAPVIYRTDWQGRLQLSPVADYTLDGQDVVLPVALPEGATLDWTGALYYDAIPSLLPPNATSAERAIESAQARLGDVPVPLPALWNPRTCPEDLLPWLAWALSIDAWKSYWPIEVKRARVAAAIEIQRRKGTAKSLRDVVESFGGAVELTEWWQQDPPATPHTFQALLTLSGRGGDVATAQYVDDIIAEIDRTKPVRSHYTFTQGVNFYGAVGIVAVARACTYARLQLTEAP